MPINEVSQGVKQHAVPQNIMQVEFKVIGELTMRQFFYLILGAVFAFAAYASGLPKFIAIPFALALAGLALAVAFLPIQDRSMDVWVVNFISAIYTPTQRIWKKEVEPPSYFLYQNANLLKTEMLTVAPTASRRKLEQYLERENIERSTDPLEQREAEYAKKIMEALDGSTTTQQTRKPSGLFKPYQSFQSATTRTAQEVAAPQTTQTQPATQEVPVTQPYPSNVPGTKRQDTTQSATKTVTEGQKESVSPFTGQAPTGEPLLPKDEPKKSKEDIKEPVSGIEESAIAIADNKPVAIKTPQASSSTTSISTPKEQVPVPKLVTQEAQQTEVKKQDQEQSRVPAVSQPTSITKAQTPASSITPAAAINVFRTQEPKKRPKISYTPYNAITPDRLAGRRFTHLTAEQGEIILPIRGERVINTVSEEKKFDSDLEKKTKDLMSLIDKIKKDATNQQAKLGTGAKQDSQKQVEAAKNEAQSAANQLRSSNDALEREIEELRKKMQESSAADKQRFEMEIIRLQNEKKVADTQVSALQQKINDLQQKLYQTVQSQKQTYDVTSMPSIPMSTPSQLPGQSPIQGQKSANPQAQQGSTGNTQATSLPSTQPTSQPVPQQTTQAPQQDKKPAWMSQFVPPPMTQTIPSAPTEQVKVPEMPPVKQDSTEAKPANFAQTPSFVTQPNLINGIVKDKEGKLVDTAVVIIKDLRGDVVRALKTNKLGQFCITTPVANGKYRIEVTTKDEEAPQTFEPVAIEVKGGVLPPVEFIGKL